MTSLTTTVGVGYNVGSSTERVVSGKNCSSSGAYAFGLPILSRVCAVRCAKERSERLVCTRRQGKNGRFWRDGRKEKRQHALSDDMAILPVQSSDPVDQQQGLLVEPEIESEAVVQGLVGGFSSTGYPIELSSTAGVIGGTGVSEVLNTLTATLYQPRWIWFATSAEEENRFIDRAINATIAGSAGALLLTKALTVDHDYWHGWTVYEILKNAPVHNWQTYEEMLKSHPVLAKMMISGSVYSLGDWIAQCYEGKPVLEFNRARMLRSGMVGFCLHGSMSHFYYHFCEWIFPFKDWWVVPLKVAFDQTIWSGFWNSVYFVTLGLLRLESPASIFSELRETFFPLLSAGWKLWPFAHLVTYGLIPVEQRLLWVDMVEIVWVTILSMLSNEKSEARMSEAATSDLIPTENILYLSAEDLKDPSNVDHS